MLAGTALKGKATGGAEGDSCDSFANDLSAAETKSFFDAADPTALAIAHLGSATTRIIYDLQRVPVRAAAIERETHVADLAEGAQTSIQLRLSYSDGFGRVAQAKARAAPGPLDPEDPASQIATPRWLTTGATIYNNKGLPVRKFEPFFAAVPAVAIEQRRLSSTLLYDPAARVVAALHPNHTFQKAVFDAWQQETWDVNATTALDPKVHPEARLYLGRV